jgi:ABC-type dipeptide/oligopeptide/nickel transport system permease subunit
MSTDVTAVTPVADLRGERRNLLRATLRNPLGLTGAIILTVIVLGGVFASLLAPQGPAAASLNAVFAPPSAQHWLGGDSAGRDVFARLVFGARLSAGGALLATAVATVLGVPSGLIAGYYGRAFDAAASWIANLFMALPAIVVLLALRVLQRQRKMAVLLVTHNFGVVADLCDRVYVMHEGTIVEANTAAGIYRAPANPYTRHLLSHILEGGPARADLDKAAALGGAS